jgi:hypothetical protein
VADLYLPKSLPEPVGDVINRPVIRIASVQQPPERVVIDTSQPTIVPPPTPIGNAALSEPSPLQSYASAAPPTTRTGIDVDHRKWKVIKRQGPKVAANQPPLVITPTAAASGNSAATVPPTRAAGEKFIQPKLRIRLVDKLSVTRPIVTILVVGASDLAHQSELGVASRREVQCP